jgi:hypothetical protein
MNGTQGAIGIGKETNWGTAVASTRHFSGRESISEERGRLREPFVFGSRATQPADPGRVRIRGGITEIQARPQGLGDLLRAALGVPVSAVIGATTYYTHTFTPGADKFSAEAALPPYSTTAKRGGLVHRYGGGQMNSLTLRQARDGLLLVDTDWLFKSVASAGSEVLALESGSKFRYSHLAVTKGGSAFGFLEDLQLQIQNNLEPEETLNGSDEISAVDWSDVRAITATMTLSFRDETTYAAFRDATTAAWAFKWTITAAQRELEIKLPKLQIETWGAPIPGPGRMTVNVTARAEYDSSAGHDLQAILTNDLSAY